MYTVQAFTSNWYTVNTFADVASAAACWLRLEDKGVNARVLDPEGSAAF